MSVPFPPGFIAFRREEIEDSIPGRFLRQVEQRPDALAVRFGDRSVSYGGLAELSGRVAAALLNGPGMARPLPSGMAQPPQSGMAQPPQSGMAQPPQSGMARPRQGGGQSEPVVILAGQGIPLIASIMGVLRAGKFYVPIDPAWPLARIRLILGSLGTRLVVTEEANAALAATLDPALAVINTERLEPAPDAPLPRIDPNAPAYVYFTSGSTGEPKGVVDSHRNVLHNVMRYTNGLGISAGDRMTLLQSSTFSGAVSSMFGALLNGAVLFPWDPARSTPGALAEWINREQITIYHSVPTLFRSFVVGRHFPSVRVIRLEGDRASHRDVELFRAHFSDRCRLVNGLGATETGLVRRFVVARDTIVPEGIIPIGYPVEDMDVMLLDEAGGLVPAGAVGEIAVRSDYLATGYWNQLDLTAKAFTADGGRRVYRTGDLGRMRDDGCLEYLGRTDFRAKIRGHTVEVAEIEQALLRKAEIREAVVVARELAGGEQGLVAYFTRSEGAPPVSVRDLREHVGSSLPSYMVPARFMDLASLPLNANGKIDRAALPVPPSERPEGAAQYVAPSNALQDTIAGIWEELLNISPVGIRDAFLDLGGDSLLAVRMIERVGQSLDRKVSLEVLAKAATVEELSLAVLDSEARDLSAPLVALQTNGARTPFYFLHGDYWSDGLFCIPLAAHLDDDRPVYLMPPAGLDGSGIPASIEAMAERHLQSLLAVQPRGPYLLGGNCNGGLVAFEMARRLVAAGDQVDLLVVIRARAGEAKLRFPRRLVRMIGAGLRLNGEREGAAWSETRRLIKRWEQLSPSERNRRILAKVRKRAARLVGTGNGERAPAIPPSAPVDRRVAMRDAFMRAADEYVPLAYPGRVTLFWPEHDPASPEAAVQEWERVVREVDLQVVPGDHVTYSTRHLPEFGMRLRDCLRAVQGES